MTWKAKEGAKRTCRVSLDEEEYAHLEHIAANRNITVEEWLEEIIRRDLDDYRRRSASIQSVIEDAALHNFPTADIEQMLKEIESGYNSL